MHSMLFQPAICSHPTQCLICEETFAIAHFESLIMNTVADATGKFESGYIDGNAFYEGRYLQCIRANENVANIVMEPLYCAAYWVTVLPALVLPPRVCVMYYFTFRRQYYKYCPQKNYLYLVVANEYHIVLLYVKF